MRYRKLIKFYLNLMIGLAGILLTFFAYSSNHMSEPQIEWRLTQYWPHSTQTNLWAELANHFQLNHHLRQPAVQHEIRFLQRRQDYITELTQNARPYLYYVYSQIRRHNLPAEIALLPMIESDYNPFGISRTGATGLWQMMPGTAAALGLKIDWRYDDRRNIIKSTNAALKHLEYLHSYFGNWLLALAAYDSGDGTVRAAIRYNKRHGRPTDFWHLPLPLETKLYVPKILGIAAVIAHKNHYGLHLKHIPNRPYFDGIKMKMRGQNIAMKKVAKMAHTSLKIVHKLNPAFRHWTTATMMSNYWLLLPADKANLFQNALSHLKKSKETRCTHHLVIQGDSLSKLANLYHTKISILKRINHIESDVIRTGQKLLIPNYYSIKKISASTQPTKRTADT